MFQFLVYFLNWKLTIDPKAKVVLEQLEKLALFKFVDTKRITNELRAFVEGVELEVIECNNGTA